MKNKYFKFVEIDNENIVNFLTKHPELRKFISSDIPFSVRVGKKPYASLIHGIICQDATSEEASNVATKLVQSIKKISAKRVGSLTQEQLINICGKSKGEVIKKITDDVLSKHLNLKQLLKSNSSVIVETLSKYEGLSLNTIKQFALFGCFKQDILCYEDIDFIEGLKIYLNKQDITKQDIINIEQQFSNELTLFSLCMWRIRNERAK